MPRPPWSALALILAISPLPAQEWLPGSAIDVVRRAAQARAGRDADTVLATWQASAHGLVRFAAVIDHGNGPVERVIRADELRVEVYGQAPNRSKQVITAWRDTIFQPTSILYHRDHLGIVANDFGPMIRLGDGDEVRDVPHPLSGDGLAWYRFRLGDTLLVTSASGTVRVVAVDVRPADPEAMGIVGTLLLDVDRAALVRLEATFTAASYRDPTVSRIILRLESALHAGTRWLPWRQAIAIHRAAPLLAWPLETVIRADWTIDDYQLGVMLPGNRFTGAAVDGLRRPGGDGDWSAWPEILGALPASDRELADLEAKAQTMVRERLLSGLPRLRLLADDGMSSVLRINRVEGVAIGAGVRLAAPLGITTDLNARLATATGRLSGSVRMSHQAGKLRIAVEGGRAAEDIHAWPRRSGLGNSLLTLTDNDDAGDWRLADRLGIAATWPADGWLRRLGLERHRISPMATAFEGWRNPSQPNPEFAERSAWMVTAALGQSGRRDRGWQLDLEAGVGSRDWLRSAGRAWGRGPIGSAWQVNLGWGSADLPADRGFAIGGAGSLPGTVPRSVNGTRVARVEVSRPFAVAVPSRMLLGPVPLESWLTPFVAVGWGGGVLREGPWPGSSGIQPVLGLRLDLWGPLLRAELGWAPRGRGFGLAGDAHPDWWPIL